MSSRRSFVRCLGFAAVAAMTMTVMVSSAPPLGATSATKPARSLQPTEVNVSRDPTNRYGEPQIAVNPKNPNNLAYAVLAIGVTYACQRQQRPECEQAHSVYGPQPRALIENKPGFSHVRVYVSFDRGKTWRQSKVPAVPCVFRETALVGAIVLLSRMET